MTDFAKQTQIGLALGGDPLLSRLIAEIQRFGSLLRHYGISIKVDSPKARIAWATLPLAAKENILKGFSNYHRDCLDLHNSGVSLRDNYAVLAHCLKRANLFALEDVKGFVADNHIVEVYNLDHIQLFRSINFFDYCNYSMLDLLAREWFDLYDRLSSITDYAMNEFLGTIASGKLHKLTVPLHILKERDSSPRGVFNFDFQYCCPLYSKPGVAGGYLLTESVTELALFAPGDENVSFLR